MRHSQQIAERYKTDNPFDIFEDVLADQMGDVGHKRLTRWTWARMNVEIESWAFSREFEEASKAYHEMTNGKDTVATFDFNDFLGPGFFTPLNAKWKDDDGRA